jgi:hypothetical protein
VYLERFTDPKGDLFIKFPLINNLVNERGWAATPQANARYAATAIGKPITLMLDKEMSLFHDYHPFSLKPGASNQEHIEFARRYAYGTIVDVTTDSGKYKAASGEIPWFGIARVDDETVKAEWLKPASKLLPPGFSPGIIQLDGPDNGITKYEILHVASVPSGAFGPKFVTLAKCQGALQQCAPQLRAASQLIEAGKTYKQRTNCCPLEAFSSLHIKSANSDNKNMSLNPNANSTPGPGTFPSTGTGVSTSGDILATQQMQQQKAKPTVRFTRRTQSPTAAISKEPNGNGEEDIYPPDQPGEGEGQQPQQEQQQVRRRAFNDPEIIQMKKELRENLERSKMERRYNDFSKHIPKVLFMKGGKVDEKAWASEVEKRVKNPKWEVGDVIDFYETKMLNSELTEVPLVRRASSPYSNPLGILQGASSLESDEERIKAEKCLRLNGGF